jgi:hypothetical protein
LAARGRDLVVEQRIEVAERHPRNVDPRQRHWSLSRVPSISSSSVVDKDLEVLLEQPIAFPRLRGAQLGELGFLGRDEAPGQVGLQVDRQPVELLEPGLRGVLGLERACISSTCAV